jgi:hypothetical protein
MVKALIPEGAKLSEIEYAAYYLVDARFNPNEVDKPTTKEAALGALLRIYPRPSNDAVAVNVAVGFPEDSEHFGRFSAEYQFYPPYISINSLSVDLDCPGGEAEAVAFARAALYHVGELVLRSELERSGAPEKTPYSFPLTYCGKPYATAVVHPVVRESPGKSQFTLGLSEVRHPDVNLEDFRAEITQALNAELANPGSYSVGPTTAEPSKS